MQFCKAICQICQVKFARYLKKKNKTLQKNYPSDIIY